MFNKFQKNLGDALEFPTDVVSDGPRITITGRQQIVVENFLEIVTFAEDEICLLTSEGELAFSGKDFVLKTILPTELRIEGKLVSLVYKERGKL